jgi:small subunit ribosomal protein S9
MAEDERKDLETSEGDETSAEGSEGSTAGPDAASGGPAGGREASVLGPPESTPPADESSDDQDETAVDTPDESPAAEQDEPEAETAPPEKKKDVIPGADLEPIAVEPEERPLSAEEQARKEAEEEERRAREAVLVGDSDEEEQAASRAPAKLEGDARYLATGKRKNAIARVTLLPGNGKIEINGRPIEEFFSRPLHQTTASQPLAITGYESSVDVRVRVHGGGISGQAGAVRHGIARALTEVDPELRGELKRRGFLTRDARAKERRKAGLKKARKRPQFSKR